MPPVELHDQSPIRYPVVGPRAVVAVVPTCMAGTEQKSSVSEQMDNFRETTAYYRVPYY
jgi:hypothetical protein